MSRLLSFFKPDIPPVAVLLEPPLLAALRVDKLGRQASPVVTHESACPEGALSGDGPQQVAEAVLYRLGNPKRLNAVLGDALFKSQIIDLTEFPKGEAERLQVLRWHIRKHLDYPAEAARLRYYVLKRTPTTTSLWVSAIREEQVSLLEAAFRAKGCHLGYIGSSSVELFNLARARDMASENGTTLLLNRTACSLTFLFSEQGVPTFFRCKELPEDGDGEGRAERVSQELRLTLAYYKERMGGNLQRVLVRRAGGDAALPLEEAVAGCDLFDLEQMVPEAQRPIRPTSLLPLYGLMEEC